MTQQEKLVILKDKVDVILSLLRHHHTL